MDKRQFRQWLLNQYRPPVEQANDEQGGFLVPHFMTVDKAGHWAAIIRRVGMLFRNQNIYKIGTYQADLHAAILDNVKSAKISRKGLK